MNAARARRQAGLAGGALAGALGAIALTSIGDDEAPPPRQVAVEWQQARVAVLALPDEPTACGETLASSTAGVSHPVLPCGARIVLDHGGRRAETEVVARGPVPAGLAFEVTPALAGRLGIAGETEIRWRFAG